MDLYFLDHLFFFWTLGIINNHITEKSLYFENQPAIILNGLTGANSVRCEFSCMLFFIRQSICNMIDLCFVLQPFRTSSDLRRHERTHTGEKNYECDQCGKKFTQGWHVIQHKRMHMNFRPWECALCGKKFRSKYSLEHHEKWHAGIKEYECATCHKRFSTKTYLENHQV